MSMSAEGEAWATLSVYDQQARKTPPSIHGGTNKIGGTSFHNHLSLQI